jgi:hypothetical protein
MRKLILLSTILCFATTLIGQQPQIARVGAAGNTTIYTDIKLAINEAMEDDIIYIPGAAFSGDSITIKKRIHLIGTGHYPDSTLASGLSIINMPIYFIMGSDGASIQGLQVSDIVNSDFTNSSITISKCFINGIITYVGSNAVNSTLNIHQCVLKGINANNFIRILLDKSVVLGNNITDAIGYSYALYGLRNSIVTNCIFPFDGIQLNASTSTFRHNIFYTSISIAYLDPATTIFNYNLLTNATSFPTIGVQTEIGNTAEGTFNNTFVNVTGGGFNYSFDYRLKNTSVGNSLGGSSVGIYASPNPYNPNPINPHIYYKSIAPATNAQGQLQINVKVKAQ